MSTERKTASAGWSGRDGISDPGRQGWAGWLVAQGRGYCYYRWAGDRGGIFIGVNSGCPFNSYQFCVAV